MRSCNRSRSSGYRATAGERRRKHDHYLREPCTAARANRGCSSTTPATNKASATPYYICTGRATKRTSCYQEGRARWRRRTTRRRLLPPDRHHRAHLRAARTASRGGLHQRLAERSQALDDLTGTKHRLEPKRTSSSKPNFADAIDLPTLKRHQDRIRIALADVTKRLEAERHDHEGPRQHLATALHSWPTAPMYERTDDLGKRLANQAFYQRSSSPKTKKRRSSSTSRSPPSHPHQTMSGVLLRLIWWS